MDKLMRQITKTLALAAFILAIGPVFKPAFASSDPLRVHLAGTDWLLPFQKSSLTQLYSFVDKKGYPAFETELAGWGNLDAEAGHRQQLSFGAAAVIGTSKAVPFVAFQTRLSDKFFDTTNNKLFFGVWGGHREDVPHQKRIINETGIKVSTAIW